MGFGLWGLGFGAGDYKGLRSRVKGFRVLGFGVWGFGLGDLQRIKRSGEDSIDQLVNWYCMVTCSPCTSIFTLH